LYEDGYSERQKSDKLKFSKTGAVARFKTFVSFHSSRTGRPKVTGQEDDYMIKKTVVRLPTTLSKNIWWNSLLTGADILKHSCSD